MPPFLFRHDLHRRLRPGREVRGPGAGLRLLALLRRSRPPRRGGLSDGASYALSLGLLNGDLFTHVIAFSPGFVAKGTRRGNPQVFVSHGLRDQVLPIDRCSRRIVRDLRGDDYVPARR
jgi:hypothetical protein